MTAITSDARTGNGNKGKGAAQAAPVEKTAETPATSGAAETAPATEAVGEAAQKRGKGAIPTMPICAVYTRPDGKTVAAVVSPAGKRYEVVGRGKGSAVGELVDIGFTLSSLHLDPPVWVTNNKVVPEGMTVVGYANISGFPLPPQD
jgi:hypothetical protein